MNPPITILRLPAVRVRCGLSRSNVYRQIKAGSFPAPVSLGARSIGWRSIDIENWLQSRVTKVRGTSNTVDAEITPVRS